MRHDLGRYLIGKEAANQKEAGRLFIMDGENSKETSQETLSAMEDQLISRSPEPAPKPKATVSSVAAPPPKAAAPKRGAKKETAEEAIARVKIARANARTIVSTVEKAKELAAENIFGMSWDGAKITSEEETDLIVCLTQYLESVGWDLSNPKVGLVVLVLTEARITLRQIATLKGLLPAQEKKDAVAK